MASKEILRRALPHWPHDALRPTAQLGSVLSTRLQPPATQTTPTKPLRPISDQETNAILSLLTNKFSQKHALAPPGESLSGGIMAPRSNPGYYQALLKDLEEVPERTGLQKLGIRLKGMFRWS